MTLRERIESIKKYLKPAEGGLFIPPNINFPHDKWAKKMLDDMKAMGAMGNIMAEAAKPEPNDPMTKALIVQHLSDIMVKHPNVPIRRIISDVFADGVKDDYDLLDKLIAADKAGFKDEKSGTEIMIRSKLATRRVDDLQDAMSYMQRGMLDNLHTANNPRVIAKPARLDGCSDPADTTGSCDAK
jgi:hypothetical protein